MSLVLAWVMRGGWRFIAGAALVLAIVFGIWRYGHQQYNRGVDDLAAKWAASEAKAAAVALTLAQQRQSAVDAAEVAGAERDRVYALKTAPIKVEVQNYVKSPAAVVRCVDPVGVSIGAKVIAAANAATSAAR